MPDSIGRYDTFGKLRLALATAIVLSACDAATPVAPSSPIADGSTPEPAVVKVAFIQDLSPEGALARTLPAWQALELAFSNAAVRNDDPVALELVTFDVAGDPAEAVAAAAEIATDPGYVAAFAAPYLGGQLALARALEDVPLISLSAIGSVPDAEPGTWLRFVAPLRAQAFALAELVTELPAARRGVCLAPVTADGGLDRALRRAIGDGFDVTDAAGAADALEAGCGVVVWTGDGLGGAGLALELKGSRTTIVGGSRLRDPDFLELAGRSAEGALSICACADVSTSLDRPALRFIQHYQSEYGSAPGPFAVEAWDAAHVLLQALAHVEPSTDGLRSWLTDATSFDGLVRTYRWVGGEVVAPLGSVRTYRVEGGRWIRLEAGDAQAATTSQA